MTSSLRLQNKIAVVVGGGQTPGETIGNGRATSILFGREGAHVIVADRDLNSARETANMITEEGGSAEAIYVDITDEESIKEVVGKATQDVGRIDILHNNVGVSIAGGDAVVTEIEMESFSRVMTINLHGMVATCKHVLPVMRAQEAGVIINIGSMASFSNYPYIGYKTSKAGVVALTENIAIRHAQDGIRANAVLPGTMNTPMAIESRAGRGGESREEVIRRRDQGVPLGGKMGTGWDVAHAAVFLASEKAGFISGAILPVDGARRLAGGS